MYFFGIPLDYVNVSRWLTILGSIATSYGMAAQAFKILRTKSARDVSKELIIALLFSEVAWINYGFAIKEWPILLICGINMIWVLLLAYGFFKYKNSQ